MGDYKTPAEALTAAVGYILRDGSRTVPSHRLTGISFGRRANLAGADGGYYWSAQYITEAENGEVPPVTQTTEEQIRMASQAWAEHFETIVKPMEVL